jgi:hypothetical protein
MGNWLDASAILARAGAAQLRYCFVARGVTGWLTYRIAKNG